MLLTISSNLPHLRQQKLPPEGGVFIAVSLHFRYRSLNYPLLYLERKLTSV